MSEPGNALLDNWETDVRWSICGGAAFLGTLALAFLARSYSMLTTALVLGPVCLMFYAAIVYPSYFGERPALVRPAAVSFYNAFFGCIVFGCIWNASLTKRQKGFSHVLAVALFSLPVLVPAALALVAMLL